MNDRNTTERGTGESYSPGAREGTPGIPGYTPQVPTAPREEREFPKDRLVPEPKRPSANELLIDDCYNF